jgi:hypothetical protein
VQSTCGMGSGGFLELVITLLAPGVSVHRTDDIDRFSTSVLGYMCLFSSGLCLR